MSNSHIQSGFTSMNGTSAPDAGSSSAHTTTNRPYDRRSGVERSIATILKNLPIKDPLELIPEDVAIKCTLDTAAQTWWYLAKASEMEDNPTIIRTALARARQARIKGASKKSMGVTGADAKEAVEKYLKAAGQEIRGAAGSGQVSGQQAVGEGSGGEQGAEDVKGKLTVEEKMAKWEEEAKESLDEPRRLRRRSPVRFDSNHRVVRAGEGAAGSRKRKDRADDGEVKSSRPCKRAKQVLTKSEPEVSMPSLPMTAPESNDTRDFTAALAPLDIAAVESKRSTPLSSPRDSPAPETNADGIAPEPAVAVLPVATPSASKGKGVDMTQMSAEYIGRTPFSGKRKYTEEQDEQEGPEVPTPKKRKVSFVDSAAQTLSSLPPSPELQSTTGLAELPAPVSHLPAPKLKHPPTFVPPSLPSNTPGVATTTFPHFTKPNPSLVLNKAFDLMNKAVDHHTRAMRGAFEGQVGRKRLSDVNRTLLFSELDHFVQGYEKLRGRFENVLKTVKMKK